MADTINLITDLENLFQSITVQILGYTGDVVNNIRISWPQEGQPAFKISDNLMFLRITEVDDPINRQRDNKYNNDETQDTSYTRVIQAHWTAYGVSAYDDLTFVKDSLFNQNFKDIFKNNNLFMILDTPNIDRVPEEFEGQWWQRSDLKITFNEFVKRNSSLTSIQSANITIIKNMGDSINVNISS